MRGGLIWRAVLAPAALFLSAAEEAKAKVGGQAVLEGVMMRGERAWAVSVRKPNGEIVRDQQPLPDWSKRYPVFKRPVLRGALALGEAMYLAVKALGYSAMQVEDGEGEVLSGRQVGLTVALGLLLAVGLFFVFPVWLSRVLAEEAVTRGGGFGSTIALNLVEGGFRVAVFLIYLVAVSFVGDVRRVFEYHGAEHKTIHAFEAGEPLSVENVQKHGCEHVRCGTSFLLVVMIVAILIFAFLGRPESIIVRIGQRLLVLPIVAGIGYELIKYAGRHPGSLLVRIVMSPGMALQRLTTRTPDDSQVEVAIDSLKAVLAADRPA